MSPHNVKLEKKKKTIARVELNDCCKEFKNQISPIIVLIKGKHEIISLQIAKEDGLPKNICQRCIYKLDMFYEFRLSCISTETILKNYAESLKNIGALNNQASKIFHYVHKDYVKLGRTFNYSTNILL